MRTRTLLKVIVLGDSGGRESTQEMMSRAFDSNLRLILLRPALVVTPSIQGDVRIQQFGRLLARVGKTSLLNSFLQVSAPNLYRYVHKRFSQQYRSTIGADFVTKELQIEDTLVTLQVWDTAGQERFRSLGAAFYRGADCCVLVYDVNVLKSFDALESWQEELKKASPDDPKAFPFILVGNKVDIDGGNSREVSYKNAIEWCASKGDIPNFETSAKEDYNIDAAFLCIAKMALDNANEQDLSHAYSLPSSTTTLSYSQSISNAGFGTEQSWGGCAC